MKALIKGRADGFLLIFGGLAIGLVLWLAPAVDASGRDTDAQAKRDFDGLVRSIGDRYQVHGKSVPMMWLANVCARSITHGGVRGIKVVEFEDASKIAVVEQGGSSFSELVKTRLGERWSPLVRTHEAKGDDSFVYAQSSEDGQRTRLIVVSLDRSELNMVSMTLNPDQLAKWEKEEDTKNKQKSTAETND